MSLFWSPTIWGWSIRHVIHILFLSEDKVCAPVSTWHWKQRKLNICPEKTRETTANPNGKESSFFYGGPQTYCLNLKQLSVTRLPCNQWWPETVVLRCWQGMYTLPAQFITLSDRLPCDLTMSSHQALKTQPNPAKTSWGSRLLRRWSLWGNNT